MESLLHLFEGVLCCGPILLFRREYCATTQFEMRLAVEELPADLQAFNRSPGHGIGSAERFVSIQGLTKREQLFSTDC